MAADSQETRVAVVESRLDNHEKVCGERYGEISGSFERIHNRLDGINTGVRVVLAGMVLFLLGVIGTLLMTGLPWDKTP